MTREEIEQTKLVQKGRRGILRIVFGRTAVIIVLIALQAILLFAVMRYFSQYVPAFFGGHLVFAMIIVFLIINKGNNPTVQLSWTILTFAVPVVGGLFYLYVDTYPGQRILERHLEGIYRETQKYVKQDAAVEEALAKKDKGMAQLAEYVRKHGNFSVYQIPK